VLLPRSPIRAVIVAAILVLLAGPALFAQESETVTQGRRLAHVVLSHGLYDTMMDQTAGLAVKLALGAVEKELTRELSPSEHAALVAAVQDAFVHVFPIRLWEDAFAPIYAKYLSASDMTDMLTFYQTNLGQKLLSLESRLVVIDGMQLGESSVKAHETEFRDRLQQRIQEILRPSPLATNAATGSHSFGPEIQFDTKGVDFGPWIRPFIAQVKRNWFISSVAMSEHGHVVITFNIQKNGTITDVEVQTPSSVDAFNDSAKAAILRSAPTQPLPSEYPAPKAFFTVTFYYNESPRPN